MFSKIRRRFTYANVVATLALVFAMSGGAYAASHYIITSPKQIKPSVLSSLKGKSGAAGPAGPAGAAGPQGPAGSAGAKGETGTTGEKGAPGSPGEPGAPGKEGSPWTAGGTLPPEATEKGTWANIDHATAADELSGSPISFSIPLAAGLGEARVHYLLVGEKGNGKGCPVGSEASKPEAEPGNLCVFARLEENIVPNPYTLLNPEAETEEEEILHSGRTGVVVLSMSAAAGEQNAYGTWAVTAAKPK
jgi:hypothetical protein